MNFTKLALTTITGLGLLAAAPAAFAIPFSVTAATQTIGTGYGVDSGRNAEDGGTLLDVQFINSFSAQFFSLDVVNDFQTFTIGTVNFAETDSGNGNNAGIKSSAEQDFLDVSWTFTFANPLSGNQLLSKTATATPGAVSDTAVDYVLDWSDVLVDFGSGGQFSVSLNELSFSSVGTQTQTATITLLALPGVTSPLVGQDVPEPASLALMGLAMAGLAATRRRKQASS